MRKVSGMRKREKEREGVRGRKKPHIFGASVHNKLSERAVEACAALVT